MVVLIPYIIFYAGFLFWSYNLAKIPTVIEASLDDAIELLAGEHDAVANIDVRCYHVVGSGENTSIEVTFETSVPVPVREWVHLGN